MIFAKVDTIIVRVDDLDVAQAWYEEKLDLSPNFWDEEQRIVVMETGADTSLTLWERAPDAPPAPPPKSGSYPIFFTEDLPSAHRLLAGRGVRVGEIEGEEGSTRWFGFTDPFGNWMEICTY